MDLSRNFKNKVNDDLKILNGEEFERFSRYILELELNEKIIHKGQNLFAKPVGYTADFANIQYEIIGQSGTDEGYFNDFQKPYKDILGALKNHKLVKTIYLFSNRYAGTSRLGDLIKFSKDKNIIQQIIPFDTERIAELILDKIVASHIIDKIFKFLPSAFELYKILPKTFQIPLHKGKYYERIEELEIIDKLEEQSVVQLYGLSGIGKTEITIGIAQKLLKKYDTIIWIEGDSIQNSTIDFNAIKISKFDKLINLVSVLESYNVCVFFDNINNNTVEIKDSFIKYNKKNSVCIMSSLTRSLPEKNSIKLNDISHEIAEKILFSENPDLEDEKRNKILSYTGKHPLILKILSSSIQNRLLDWNSLISEFSDLNRLNDSERNQTISNRIIGKIKKANEKELFALNFINNRFITQSFLQKLIGKIGINKLIDNSILDRNDTKFYSTHQIIMDSIKSELTKNKWLNEFTEKIKEYLLEHNETKDVSFYNAMYNHRKFFNQLYDITKDTDLKRIILYSLIQSTDITIIEQINILINKIPSIISENRSYYENLLTIELLEINLSKINKKKNQEEYINEAENAIEKLKEFINIAEQNSHKISILHHIGKFYFKIEREDLALEKFEEVLNLSPNDPFALLQIARIANKADDSNELNRILNIIFALENCPLPILLSFYELIIYNGLEDLRTKYIDEKIDFFISNIIDAIDSRYDQPYNILGKISSHLSYNSPHYFETIIDNLPIPANVDFSEKLRFNFAVTLLGAFKFFKYNGEQDINVAKMEKIFKLANANFELANLDSNYKKSQYIDLLIEAGKFDLAEIQARTFEDENEFNFQKWSKIYRGQKNYKAAIESADKAINFKAEQQDRYLSAFLNDKAEAENANGMKSCIGTLENAIEKQENPKTKKQWSEKLTNWRKNYL